VYSGADPGALATGDFGGGLDLRTRASGDTLDVELRVPANAMNPMNWGTGGLEWSLGFTPDAVLSLLLETGASESRLDLTDLQVADLKVQTGASSTEVHLPANAGVTSVEVHSGAAAARLYVPSNVAARIRFTGGLSSIDVDQTRFPFRDGVYQSLDYEMAANRVDMRLEAGVGAIEVR
jgi:hypothetical protein